MRVVIDAMIWISAVLGRPGSASHLIVEAFTRGDMEVLTCGSMVDEVADVLLEDFGAAPSEVESFVALICARAEILNVLHQDMGSPDPKDNPLLEVAIAGNADHVVTRDKALLERLPGHVVDYLVRNGIAIIHPEAFVKLLP